MKLMKINLQCFVYLPDSAEINESKTSISLNGDTLLPSLIFKNVFAKEDEVDEVPVHAIGEILRYGEITILDFSRDGDCRGC